MRRPTSILGLFAALVAGALVITLVVGGAAAPPTRSPVPTAAAALPSTPSPSSPEESPPAASPAALPTGLPMASPVAVPSAAPQPTPVEHFPSPLPEWPRPTASPSPVGAPAGGRPTRVVIGFLGIDLPIVAGDLRVRGNRNNYPLCDVAQYMMEFGWPGDEGTTYIYAHAQRGMFLPMLRASWRNNGRAMIGQQVEVYTADLRRHVYEIVRVKRHSTDLRIAFNVAPGEQQLVLQTSEGPPGHRPVLQVAARPLRVDSATAAEARPEPRPRACLPR